MKLKISAILASIASTTILLLLFTGNQYQRGMSLAENKEIEETFIQYIARYGKSYAFKEEVSKRFEIFSRTYKMIQMHNQREDKTFEMGLNQFSDIDRAERMTGINIGDVSEFISERNLLNQTSYPSSVDWRQTGNVSPILDQKDCGSCWAFSTVSSLESALSIKNKVTPTQPLSIQYLVDCDTYNNGCNGGL
jgi:C1A family cysteine protease